MSTDANWNRIATDLLVGRTIRAVSYMTVREAEENGWTKRPVVMTLDNGLRLLASADDEGNDGGALFTTSEETPCLPVL